jgi:sulfite dehydrogenase (quinone) subunit SoeC
MHPAFSVIFLTTLIGVGQGFFLALYLADVGALLQWLPAQDTRGFFALGSAISVAFLGLGLFASFFHLGRPERGWRAVAKWRVSWLSREVIVLPAFMASVAGYGLAHYAGVGAAPALIVGALAALLCFALFICTGMIYACLEFLQEWATPLTAINFTLLGCASGFTFASAFAAASGNAVTVLFSLGAIAFTLAAFVTRAATLARNARLKPKSSLQTAIGIKHPRIVQKAQGFMGGSFNTREFFHGASPRALRAVKRTFLMLVFPVPVVLLAAGAVFESTPLLIFAFVVQYAGLLPERWFFFAQANHPQNLYYQAIS